MTDFAWFIGRIDGAEHVVSSVSQHCPSARLFSSVDTATQSDGHPPLVVVFQHWSDEYSPVQISQLLNRFPLARIVVCQGTWCASDRRTRNYWPAAICVPRDQAVRRIERELQVIAGTRPPLPWTAGLDEIFAFDHSSPEPPVRNCLDGSLGTERAAVVVPEGD